MAIRNSHVPEEQSCSECGLTVLTDNHKMAVASSGYLDEGLRFYCRECGAGIREYAAARSHDCSEVDADGR